MVSRPVLCFYDLLAQDMLLLPCMFRCPQRCLKEKLTFLRVGDNIIASCRAEEKECGRVPDGRMDLGMESIALGARVFWIRPLSRPMISVSFIHFFIQICGRCCHLIKRPCCRKSLVGRLMWFEFVHFREWQSHSTTLMRSRCVVAQLRVVILAHSRGFLMFGHDWEKYWRYCWICDGH